MENTVRYVDLEGQIAEKHEIFKYVPEEKELLEKICKLLDEAESNLDDLFDAKKASSDEKTIKLWNSLLSLIRNAWESSKKAPTYGDQYDEMLKMLAKNGRAGTLFMNLYLDHAMRKVEDTMMKSAESLKSLRKDYNWLRMNGVR